MMGSMCASLVFPWVDNQNGQEGESKREVCKNPKL